MANNPITTPLPADLPTNWTYGQTIGASGIDVGLTEQHGYNYLMKQVNAAQQAATQIGQSFSGIPSLGSDGKIPASQLPAMNYDPAGSAAAVQTNLTKQDERLSAMETAFATFKQELTGKVEETSQAFSDLKTTLDKTESFSQPRRTKASGGGGDELLTDC